MVLSTHTHSLFVAFVALLLTTLISPFRVSSHFFQTPRKTKEEVLFVVCWLVCCVGVYKTGLLPQIRRKVHSKISSNVLAFRNAQGTDAKVALTSTDERWHRVGSTSPEIQPLPRNQANEHRGEWRRAIRWTLQFCS